MCDCRFCKTGRNLREIINKMEDNIDREFLEDFLFNYVPTIEEELSMLRYAHDVLKSKQKGNNESIL